MFGMFKKEYVFTVTTSDNLKSEVVFDADSLINYVIGANNHLIDTKQEGWIVATKEKRTAKKNTTLYGVKVDLPLEEDNPYFVELLAPFHTKKPLDYYFDWIDMPQQEETEEVSKIDNSTEEDEIPEELQQLMNAGQVILEVEQETPATNIAPNRNIPITSADEAIETEEQHAEYQQRIAELEYQLQALYEENQQIKQAKEASVQLVSNDSPLSANDYQAMVQQLIEREMKQLEMDIKKQDTRDTIEPTVTERINEEKQVAINNETNVLDAKKTVALEKAKEIYEQQIKDIEVSFLADKDKKTTEIEALFASKKQTNIANEYQRQTSALEQLIKERKEQLLNWKTSLSTEIEDSLKILSSTVRKE